MDGRRRNKQQPSSEKKTGPQNRIKELKKDIATLETQVNRLLEDVPSTSMDNLCVVCEEVVRHEYHDLACQHVLCPVCYDKNHPHFCPKCQPMFQITYSEDGSSSEDGKMI